MKMTFEQSAELALSVDLAQHGEKDCITLMKHLRNEVEELDEAFNHSSAPSEAEFNFNIEKEFGDVLFVMVSLAAKCQIDMTQALNLTITKLQERLKHGIKS